MQDRLRAHASPSAEIAAVLAREEVEGERNKSLLMAIILFLGLCLLVPLIGLWGEHFDAIGDEKGGRYWIVAIHLVIFSYQLVCLRIHSGRLERGLPGSRLLGVMDAILEPTFLSALLLIDGLFFTAVSMLNSPALLIYPMLILLSCLRLSWRLCILTATVAVLEYLGLVVWYLPVLQENFPSTRGDLMVVHGMRASILLLTGVAAAFAARFIRGGIELTLQSLSRLEFTAARRARLEELSLVAAGLAHETKNPLGIIRGLAQSIYKNPRTQPSNIGIAQEIMEAADRTAAQLGEFISYARIREPEIVELELSNLVGKAIEVLEMDAHELEVEVLARIPETRVRADPEMILEILLNLVLNSLQASKPGSRVEIRLEAGERGTLQLVVEDWGHGIDSELLPEVFKPYVGGDSQGNGLGLSIVRRLSEQQGWSTEMWSETGRGTTVAISGIARGASEAAPIPPAFDSQAGPR